MPVEAGTNGSVQQRRLHGHGGGAGEVVSNQVPRYVTQASAAFLLGIPEAEFRRISRTSGLGHVERDGNEEETYFTYEELRQICMLAAPDASGALNHCP
jgi:hypothetical protein